MHEIGMVLYTSGWALEPREVFQLVREGCQRGTASAHIERSLNPRKTWDGGVGHSSLAILHHGRRPVSSHSNKLYNVIIHPNDNTS